MFFLAKVENRNTRYCIFIWHFAHCLLYVCELKQAQVSSGQLRIPSAFWSWLVLRLCLCFGRTPKKWLEGSVSFNLFFLSNGVGACTHSPVRSTSLSFGFLLIVPEKTLTYMRNELSSLGSVGFAVDPHSKLFTPGLWFWNVTLCWTFDITHSIVHLVMLIEAACFPLKSILVIDAQ